MMAVATTTVERIFSRYCSVQLGSVTSRQDVQIDGSIHSNPSFSPASATCLPMTRLIETHLGSPYGTAGWQPAAPWVAARWQAVLTLGAAWGAAGCPPHCSQRSRAGRSAGSSQGTPPSPACRRGTLGQHQSKSPPRVFRKLHSGPLSLPTN